MTQAPDQQQQPLFVGIDVAKAQVDIAVRPTGECWTAPQTEAGIQDVVARLQTRAPTLVVLEATGGLERAVTAALAAAGLPVAVVNPRQVRDFAKATGRLAKTDRLDAQVLAHFAEAVRPAPRPVPEEQAQLLSAHLARRRQLVEMLTAEKNRLGTAPGRSASASRPTSPGWSRNCRRSRMTSAPPCGPVPSGGSRTTCCAASPVSARWSR